MKFINVFHFCGYLFVSTRYFAAVICKIAVLVDNVNIVFGNKAHCSLVDPDPVGLGTWCDPEVSF
jgi:hypothetical protein